MLELIIGITKFPGTNNEQDVERVLKELNIQNELILPNETYKIQKMDAIILAGGFSYGDYLRPGIIAAQTPIIDKLKEYIESDHFVIGICNGFQILCEINVLPGILTTNLSTKFISKWVHIKSEISDSPLLKNMGNSIIKIPIAHFDGRYYNNSEDIPILKRNKLIAFRYCDSTGTYTDESNPNGSIENIAGLINEKGNVLGMMPHPERASFDYLGSSDGKLLFENLKEVLKC